MPAEVFAEMPPRKRAPPKKKASKKHAGRKLGAKGRSKGEARCFLGAAEGALLAGSQEWEEIGRAHV